MGVRLPVSTTSCNIGLFYVPGRSYFLFSPYNPYLTILNLLSPSLDTLLGAASLVLRLQVLGFHLNPNALGHDNLWALFNGCCLPRCLPYIQAVFKRTSSDSRRQHTTFSRDQFWWKCNAWRCRTIDHSGISSYMTM